jgi:phosphatidylglycerophosphate synthase
MAKETLLSRYRALLKPLAIEGLPDLLLFRPIAFGLVQILKKFPVTPNQVSVSSISMGLLGGLFFALGTRLSFALGGICYGLAAVLDCADGMLARLKRSGSPLGRIIDGSIDYTNGVFVMVGLAAGLDRAGIVVPLGPWPLTALAGVSLALHCVVMDHFRCRYADQALGIKTSVVDDIRTHEEALGDLRAKGGHRLLRFVLGASLRYHRLQARIAPAERRIDPRVYARLNAPMLRAWQAIELSLHILILMIAALLFRPGIFFFYAIVFANAWLLLLAPIQYLVDRRVVALSRPASGTAGSGPPAGGHAPADGIS